MDVRKTSMAVIVLLCVFTGELAESQNVLDVCASCHVNATCDDKADGSGKVCNCKYGFVGNGRTFCQDKDECQIGSSKICGQHTTCHNTYGSYYCTCLSGYNPSNHMAVFIPNDGTHCQDINECGISGVCGEGAHCRNLEGSFDCICQVGFKVHDGVEPFHPMRDKASCKVVDCGQPVPSEDAVLQTLTGTTFGSKASFSCDDGFLWRGGNTNSVCEADGRWRGPTMVCEAKCGLIPIPANSEVLWHNSSVAIHGCLEGYYSWRGSNISECGSSGVWQEATLICKAKCGPIPILAHSKVLWHNKTIAIHSCVEGFHSWRGSNVSECGSSGLWQEATLKCIETKPPITHLSIFNEKCLQWKAEKYEEDTEMYKVIYTGSRDYQRSFRDKRKQFLNSKDEQLVLCLNLLPVTNYSISVTATSSRFTASITTNTSLPEPRAPVIYYSEFENPSPTLRLRRTSNTLDSLSVYQVLVVPVEEMVEFDCSSPASSDLSEDIAAQFDLRCVGREMNFTVGDGRLYGGFSNTPLQSSKNYYVILRAVCQWKTALKSSCVLWAKVRGTSYILRVSSLCAAAFVALAALIVLGGYSFIWCVKKT